MWRRPRPSAPGMFGEDSGEGWARVGARVESMGGLRRELGEGGADDVNRSGNDDEGVCSGSSGGGKFAGMLESFGDGVSQEEVCSGVGGGAGDIGGIGGAGRLGAGEDDVVGEGEEDGGDVVDFFILHGAEDECEGASLIP